MNVEFKRSLRRTLLKGCLWMGGSKLSQEGEQDEADQQPRLQHQRRSAHKVRVKERPSFCYS